MQEMPAKLKAALQPIRAIHCHLAVCLLHDLIDVKVARKWMCSYKRNETSSPGSATFCHLKASIATDSLPAAECNV